jgi:protease-4
VTTHRIAVVYGVGSIVDGESNPGFFFSEPVLGSDSVSRALRQADEDDRIDAIVFRVDSPGGSPFASDEVWREVERAKKPVIVSMSYVAASGGYWVSMGADKIVANPTTITGSVGVVAGKLNMEGLYKWIGINWEEMRRGENAGLFTDTRAFTPEEEAALLKWMNWVYDEFIQKISQGRSMPEGEVRQIARGRVWTGEKALELGLVDELGGLRDAIDLAKETAGIGADTEVELVLYPRPKGFFESLVDDGGVMVTQRIPEPLRTIGARMEILERWSHEPGLVLDPTLWLME